MNAHLRLAAAIFALLLPTLALWGWILGGAAGTAPDRLSLPSQVGPWQATAETRLDSKTWAIIEPDAHLMRRYEAPGRAPIWVYVGLYAGRAGYGKGAHDPEVCYPAQGWEIVRSSRISVPLTEKASLRATLLGVQLDGHQQAALYWFQPARRWPLAAALEQLARVGDALARHPQYAFVRLSAPLQPGSQTEQDLREFAAEVAWPVRNALSEPETASSEGPATRSEAS